MKSTRTPPLMRRIAAAAALFAVPAAAWAVLDVESCLMCHQYDGLAFAEAATTEVQHFEVDPELWFSSVHGSVACRDCHRDVTDLPHAPVESVNCSIVCHVIDPSTNRPFTHGPEIERFRSSVHGQGAEEDEFAEDRPACRDCHSNRLFAAHEGAWGATTELVDETLIRCRGCHQAEDWSERVLAHVMHRMRRRRPPGEVVRLCTTCHEDADRMARHGLLPMWDFRDSFHWRMILMGDPNAPDCLSCHVPVGFSAHEIHHIDDERSAINTRNVRQTCSNPGGAQSCHPGATQTFSEARIHFTERQAADILKDETIDPDVRALLAERMEAEEVFTQSDTFRFWLLDMITLFYRVLIGLTIGGMVIHQVLDFIAQRRRMRRARAAAGPGAPE